MWLGTGELIDSSGCDWRSILGVQVSFRYTRGTHTILGYTAASCVSVVFVAVMVWRLVIDVRSNTPQEQFCCGFHSILFLLKRLFAT